MNYCKNNKINPLFIEDYSAKKAEEIRNYHASFTEYEPTSLKKLSETEDKYKVKNIFIKDESSRFSLNAFKVLGGSYAAGKMLEKDSNIRTFITATDGNHGRGVAWSARHFGLNSIVYMPKGTKRERLDNILALGSDARILDLSYDECVNKAREDSEKYGYALLQDTAWDGYEEIPTYIMQGYLTMALETLEQLENKVPTHIFLQAGVGSMAASMTAFFTNVFRNEKPKIIIVEPENADCIYKTVCADDGRIHEYTGNMDTMMAGLACGVPCKTAWEILSCCADFFVTINDEAAANAMVELHSEKIESGESGSAGFGAFLEIAENDSLREIFNINKDSVILCFSTEGATDRENYSKIIKNLT